MARPPGDGGGKRGRQRRAKPSTQPRPITQPPPPYTGEVPGPPLPPGSLGIPDLPSDIEATVAQILAQDPTNGPSRALAYIRGTDWYKTTYAGIDLGIRSGVFGADAPEAEYRNWMASVRDTFKRTYGRDATQGEISAFLQQGYNANTVEQVGQGHAWAAANSPEVQYEFAAVDTGALTPEELQALGEQQSGRTSEVGTRLQQRLQAASAKIQRLFEGTLAQPNFTLGGGGLQAPSLAPKAKPDIGA